MAAGRKHREEPERDPTERAHKLLRAAKPPIDLSGKESRDPIWLAEQICDHFPSLDGMKAMHTLFLLLMDHFDAASEELIHREYYLLDPPALAEDAMARLFEDLQFDDRIHPIHDWIVDCVARSARICASDPKITWYPAGKTASNKDWMLHRICAIANGLDFDRRRLAWLVWGRKLPLKEIERQTSCPIEHLEVFIGQVIQKVVREMSPEEQRSALGTDPSTEGDHVSEDKSPFDNLDSSAFDDEGDPPEKEESHGA